MSTLSSSASNFDQTPSVKLPQVQNPVDKIEGRPLPSNLDAEQGIIAACLIDSSGEVISNCIESALRPEDFYFVKHQLIYDALLDLHGATIQADEIILTEKLKTNGNLELCGV